MLVLLASILVIIIIVHSSGGSCCLRNGSWPTPTSTAQGTSKRRVKHPGLLPRPND